MRFSTTATGWPSAIHMVTWSLLVITVTWLVTWSHAGHMVITVTCIIGLHMVSYMVTWSHGHGHMKATVTWFTARHWSGHMVWHHGHMVTLVGKERRLLTTCCILAHWSHAGRYVSHGHMVTWSHGRSLFVTWSHGHIFNMVTWSHGHMIHGHMVTWSHALVTWSHGHIPIPPRSHGHNGRYGPPSHGHMVTWSHGHMVAMVT
jgi:hypothetical protein